MIEVITPGHHYSYAPLIESMFRMRYRVLVERCGWLIPNLSGERDCDPYDTEDTVYIIDRAPDGDEVVACARLNPTTKPHMLSDLFARYCDLQGVPAGEAIYEASRIAFDTGRLDRDELMKAMGRLEWTITAFALRNGIKKVTAFISEKVYLHSIQLWPTRPLGLPAYFEADDHAYIPAISIMNNDALQRIEERRCITGAVAGGAQICGSSKTDERRSYVPSALCYQFRSPDNAVPLSAGSTTRKTGYHRGQIDEPNFAWLFNGAAIFLGAIIEDAKRIVASLCNRRRPQMRAIRRGNQP